MSAPVHTDLVYQQLELLITGHGAVYWRRGDQVIAIRRAVRPTGRAVFCTFAYKCDRLYWYGVPTESLRAAFADMPDTPSRIYTATRLGRPGKGIEKRGTQNVA